MPPQKILKVKDLLVERKMFESLGLIYFASYLLSRVGTAQQFFVIRKGKFTSRKGTNTAGISTKYRVYDNFLYLCEFFWGLSLHPINWIVSAGNFLSLIFPSLILWEIYIDRDEKDLKKWLFIYIAFVALNVSIMIYSWSAFKSFSQILGFLTLILCFLSVIGLWDNIKKIIDRRDPGKQCLPEIYLKLFKDSIGIAYGFVAGIETMYPLVIAFILRGSLRLINLIVYVYYSRTQKSYRTKKPKYQPFYSELSLQKENIKKKLAKTR